MLSTVFGDAVWRMCGGSLGDVGRLYSVGRLSSGFVDAIWKVWGGYREGLGRLFGG